MKYSWQHNIYNHTIRLHECVIYFWDFYKLAARFFWIVLIVSGSPVISVFLSSLPNSHWIHTEYNWLSWAPIKHSTGLYCTVTPVRSNTAPNLCPDSVRLCEWWDVNYRLLILFFFSFFKSRDDTFPLVSVARIHSSHVSKNHINDMSLGTCKWTDVWLDYEMRMSWIW